MCCQSAVFKPIWQPSVVRCQMTTTCNFRHAQISRSRSRWRLSRQIVGYITYVGHWQIGHWWPRCRSAMRGVSSIYPVPNHLVRQRDRKAVFLCEQYFFADYCCMTSLQWYLFVCGVVTLEEFEKFDIFKIAAIFCCENTKKRSNGGNIQLRSLIFIKILITS